MKVKELIHELLLLNDPEAEVAIVVDSDTWVAIRRENIKRVWRSDGFKGYLLDYVEVRNRAWHGQLSMDREPAEDEKIWGFSGLR